MSRLIFATALSAAIAAAAAQTADAQERKRDFRDRDKADRAPARPGRAGPTVTGFSPEAGPPGATVVIKGSGFNDRVRLMVDGKRVVPTSIEDGRITFVVPPGTRGPLTIALKAGRADVPVGRFRVVELDPPGGPDYDRDKPDRRRGPRDRDKPGGGPDYDRDKPGGGPHSDRPGRRGPVHRRPHRERPLVSSYAPRKGDAGTRVIIRGANFKPDMAVLLAGAPIKGAKVTPDRIVVTIPRGGKDGLLALRVPGARRDLVVGEFEVTRYDARAERRRIEAERRKRAEEAWKRRKAALAKSRAERQAAIEKRQAELEATRERRRIARLQALRAKFKRAFLADPETQAELGLHAERIARLERMRRLAAANEMDKLVIRIEIAIDKENNRHERRMAALEKAFKLG